jgi:RNA polymerase sigma-70 factor (ECF subfamily)
MTVSEATPNRSPVATRMTALGSRVSSGLALRARLSAATDSMTATTTEPGSDAISDEKLMQHVQAGDIGAFEVLYDRFSANAFGLARAICGGSGRAEEAVQDGFLAVWRSRASFDPTRGSARAWLLTVIRYRSLDVMRRTRRDDGRRACDEQLDSIQAPGSISDAAEQHDEAGRVRSSLLELPAAQQEVITLAYFGGLTHTEIAGRLQLPAGTVKGRMRLGLHKLRAELNPSSASA